MADSKVNAIQTLYKALMDLVAGITIKYVYKAEEFETLETRLAAEQYLASVRGMDTFFSYNDYTDEEYAAVGLISQAIIDEVRTTGVTTAIPKQFRDPLLLLRRQRTINDYVEMNNYYRLLHGIPDVECENDPNYLFYTPENIAEVYHIDPTIPIHNLQDYYDAVDGTGSYVLSILEGLEIIDAFKEEAKERVDARIRSYQVAEDDRLKEERKYEYLDYLGSNRIDVVTARSAANFQIIRVRTGNVSHRVYSEFLDIYESCREYFVAAIYVSQFRTFIEYYDNFIALCIMVMSIQQIIMRQIPYELRRSFFDIYSVKALYEMYDMPYNLRLDTDLQDRIAQNLNLLIQNKATDKVIFDIAEILGLESNIEVYKYYLSKQRKMDDWGVPIVKWTEKFNNDTGEVETIPDYNEMYDVYFQKTNLKNTNFTTTFDSAFNHEDYYEITEADPFWHEDSNVYNRVWETEYNFVESKYLGLGISYRLTDLMFKNIMLLKLIMNNEDNTGAIMINLQKITGSNLQVSVFDAVIALICLMAAKHNLTGEIITIPTQVISVLDFMTNISGGEEFLVDTLALKLDYFDLSVEENIKNVNELYSLISKHCSVEEADRFMAIVNTIATNRTLLNTEMKKDALNAIYQNANSLYILLEWLMTKTHDMKTYVAIRTMYKAAYYSKEVKDTFTIYGQETGFPRTAWNFYEYLYHRNPKLYSALFKVDLEKSWKDYCQEHGLLPSEYTYDQYMYDYEHGTVMIDFGTINASSVDDQSAKDEFIYYNANHIISQIATIIDNLEYMSMLGDMASVLEEMLEKLVRFFKSYTTELISFDTTIICDMKMENMVRLFDEIAYIKKSMDISDTMRFPYSDAIHKIIANYPVEDAFILHDRYRYGATITVDNLYEWMTNRIPFHDSIHRISKTNQVDDFPPVNLFDSMSRIISTQTIKDKPGMKFKDTVVSFWTDSDE